jgi:hypothetical protein
MGVTNMGNANAKTLLKKVLAAIALAAYVVNVSIR